MEQWWKKQGSNYPKCHSVLSRLVKNRIPMDSRNIATQKRIDKCFLDSIDFIYLYNIS